MAAGSLTTSLLVVLALWSSSASASHCTDLCEGKCSISNELCQMTGKNEGVCQARMAACVPKCAPACECVDTCSMQCTQTVLACKQSNDHILYQAYCEYQEFVCGAYCGISCPLNKLYEKVENFVDTIVVLMEEAQPPFLEQEAV